jgi:hypothetical protein
MSTRYRQMALATVIGPMSGFPTVTGRRPLPLETIPTPSPIYWPSQTAGIARTPSQTPAAGSSSPAPPAVSANGGSCCGR